MIATRRFFTAPLKYMLLPQPVSESAYVVAARYQLTLFDMVKGEQLVVSVTHVVHAKVDAGLVCGGA